MAGLFDPDPRVPPSDGPDVFARVPGVAPRPSFAGMQGIAAAGPSFAPPELPQATQRPTDPDIWLNEGTGQLYVQGHVFDGDDAQSALDTEELLSQPGSGNAPPSGWTALDVGTWGMHLNSIKNPGMGRLAKKNFGRGVDTMQMLTGRLAQFAGAEEAGQRIVGNQIEDLRKTTPFERMATDIGSAENRGVLDWFVANLAQQGPNLIESVVAGVVGAGAGAVAGGGANPFTAAGGLFMAMAGKQTYKQAVLAAAKKYATDPKTLTSSEIKLLREAAGVTAAAKIKTSTAKGLVPFDPKFAAAQGNSLAAAGAANAAKTAAAKQRAAGLLTGATPIAAPTSQAVAGGAGLATFGSSYGMGIADIYGETVEAGDPDRAAAAALGIPYALLESMPEFLLASRVFGNLGGRNKMFGTTPLADIASKGGKAAELGKRFAVGATVGGTLEGATEAGQEGLLLGVNEDVDWDSPEGMNRLVNSFAAGFGVGGPIGGVGGLFGTDGKAPANLLNPGQSPEPAAATVPLLPAPGGMEGELMPPPGGPPLLPGAAPGGATFPVPTNLGTQQGTPPGTILTGDGAIPTGPGTQGVLPLFDQMPATEMADRMGSVPALPGALPPGSGGQPVSNTFTNPQQGALQFAPPAPGPTTDFGQQLQQALAAPQRNAEFDAALNQRRLGTDYDQALAQRELQDATPAAPAAPLLAGMPMLESAPRSPQQRSLPLRLFRRGQPKVASATERRLQRGVAPAEEVDLEPTSNVQLDMFTNEGKPTVAALKGAGLRRKVKSEPAAVQGRQIPPTGKAVTPKDVAAARAGAEEKAGPKRGLKKQAGVAKVEKANAVQERSAEKVDAREQAGNGKGMGGEVAPVKTAGAGAKLRRGKAAAKQAEPDQQEKIVPKNVKPPKAVYPVLETLRAQYSEVELDPEAGKNRALALAQRMLKAGILVERDMAEVKRISADRDMTKDDILSELRYFLDRGEEILDEAAYQKATKPKEEPPPPKTEAAAAPSAAAAAPTPAPAVSAKVEPQGPVQVTVPLKDGAVLRGDGKKLLETLDSKIEKFEALLACLTGK